MAVYTEEIRLESNVAKTAEDAAAQVATLGKALEAAKASALRSAALGDAKGFEAASAKVAKFQAAIDAVPPSLQAEAAAAKRSAEITEAAGKAIAAGVSAIGAAIVAVGAGLAKIAFEGFKLALSASDAKGDLVLLFDTMGEGVVKGEEAIAMLDKLGAATGKTREELAPLASSFLAMGVTGQEQLEKLTLAAVSAGALAKGGGQAFEELFKKISTAQQTGQALKIPLKGLGSLASMGLKVDDVAKRMGISAAALGDQLSKGTVDAKKFGDALTTALVEKGAGPVADAANDLGATWARFRENVAKLFEDVDTGPFLAAVKDLFSVFDQGTESGRAMKAVVTAVFTKIFALATMAIPIVKELLLTMVVYGLKAYIALKEVAAQVAAFAESEEGAAIIEQLGFALKAAAITAGIVVAALVAVAAVVGLAVAQVGALVVAFTMASAALTSWALSAVKAGNDFVQGLVNGIVNGTASVVNAVANLAAQAKGAFTSALGIQSPSTVMAGFGRNMGAGVAMGLDSSTGAVERATEGVASASVEAIAPAPAATSQAAAPTGGGSGLTVTVEPGAIVIQGGGGGALELTEQAVAALFERIALQQGLA